MPFPLSTGWAAAPAPCASRSSTNAPCHDPDDAAAEEFSQRTASADTAEQARTPRQATGKKKAREDEETGRNTQRHGDAILAALGTLRGAGQPESAAAPAPLNNQTIDAVVRSVQVNLPAAGQTDAVRLDINPALLADTTIMVQRTEDGGLSIRISTDNARSEALLFQQADRLSSALNRLNASAVQVEINGNAAGQGGSQDGRSRNRDLTENAAWQQGQHA